MNNTPPEVKSDYCLNPSKCACRNWARILNSKKTPYTQHAQGCEFYSLERESLDLVNKLVACIEFMASNDTSAGIPDQFINDYRLALMFTSNPKMFDEYPKSGFSNS
jgi:hypothetical protein